jgi:hypothetical protein
LCFANTFQGATFQGEMVGTAPLLLHIEAKAGVVTGFYKYLSNNVLIPLKGSVDKKGNLLLTDTSSPFSSFSGKLKNRLIQGSFKATKASKPQAFYAINFRTTYDRKDWIRRCELSLEGYVCGDVLIATHIQPDGRIYFQEKTDRTANKFYLNEDANGFVYNDNNCEVKPCGNKHFILEESEGEIAEESEESEESEASLSFHRVKTIQLNHHYFVKAKWMKRSECVVKNWKSAHLQHPPHKAVKDIAQVREMLKGRVEITEQKTTITFKDGAQKNISDCGWGGNSAYFPEVDVLLLEGEATDDCPVDLNDSTKAPSRVGSPYSYKLSPDKQLRLNTYYPGNEYNPLFLEKWNPSQKKYEFVALFGEYFYKSGGWVWISNRKLIAGDYGGSIYGACYEIEIVEKKKK